jgi:hypothetical protein
MLQQLHQHIHSEHDAHLRRTVGAIENVIDDHLYPNLSVLHGYSRRRLIRQSTPPSTWFSSVRERPCVRLATSKLRYVPTRLMIR